MAAKEYELICINCPRGCLLKILQNGEALDITGNYCAKGLPYARQEITAPERVLTVLMKPEGADRPLSVRTDRPVPKAMLKECAKSIYQEHPVLPIRYGDILIENLCGTGANVIATADMDK